MVDAQTDTNSGMERVMDITMDLFWYQADRLATRQDALFRTYLWVASLFITLDILMIRHRIVCQIWSTAGIWCFVSLVTLMVILMLCLMGLRGRGTHKYPDLPIYWSYFAENKPNAMFTLFEHFWGITRQEIKEKSQRAKLLRAISWGLVLSVSFSALSALLSLP